MANNNNQNIKDLKEALLEKLPSTRVREQELLCHHDILKLVVLLNLFIEPTTMDELELYATQDSRITSACNYYWLRTPIFW